MTAAAAGRVLQLARAGYGAALLLRPAAMIRLATGRLPSRRWCRVARVLGARHLAQATLTVLIPLPEVLAAGTDVDAVHAGSMLLLAAADRTARRIALTDAAAEAASPPLSWHSVPGSLGGQVASRSFPELRRRLSTASKEPLLRRAANYAYSTTNCG